MAEHKGLLKICDRCGATVFLKTTGDGEADGGFTRWNKFEPAPAGWDCVNVGETETGHRVYKTLCPVCTAEWSRINKQFMEDGQNGQG